MTALNPSTRTPRSTRRPAARPISGARRSPLACWQPHPLAWALACALSGVPLVGQAAPLGAPATSVATAARSAAAPATVSGRPANTAVNPLPTGATVVHGQASIVTQDNRLTVTNSAGAIINWQSFDIGSGQTVRFEQPNADSKVLNRVLGRDPSNILGTLSSNGQVWLLNPYGVLFGRGAVVDVGSLVASTLAIRDADWSAGRYALTGGLGAGAVVNQGDIRTTTGGQLLLVGGSGGVRNEGALHAEGGQVLLAAGASVDLADTQAPNVAVRVQAPQGEVLNLGQVLAAGGHIDLQGAMVNQAGIVRADRLGAGDGGSVRLYAAERTTLAAGSVTSANAAQGTGGTVQALGTEVGLLGSARIEADGARGGGTVHVGGGAEGKDARVPNARAVYMASDAKISADATANGDGGNVVLWGNEATRAYGSFSARGGAQGGNGGLVETSGGWLDAQPKSVKTDAPKGKSGQWLLDPNNILITDVIDLGDQRISGDANFTTTGDNAVLQIATIKAALDAGTNVTVSTGTGGTNSEPGDITFTGTLFAGVNSMTLLPTLTLNAARHIDITNAQIGEFAFGGPSFHLNVNAGMSGQGGGIRMTNSTIYVRGDVTFGGGTAPCLTAGICAGLSATGTIEPGRGWGIEMRQSYIETERTVTMRGASAADGQVHGGIVIDGINDVERNGGIWGASGVNLQGWAGGSGSANQYGLQLINGAFVSGREGSVFAGSSRLNGAGNPAAVAVGTFVGAGSSADVPTVEGHADARTGMQTYSVQLSGDTRSQASLRGDGGTLLIDGAGKSFSTLQTSGTSMLQIDTPVRMTERPYVSDNSTRNSFTNSGGVTINASTWAWSLMGGRIRPDGRHLAAASPQAIDAPGGLWTNTIAIDTAGPVVINGELAGRLISIRAPSITTSAEIYGQDGVSLQTTSLRLNAPIGSGGTGTPIVIRGLAGNLTTLVAGPSAQMVAPNGRWLIYATDPRDSVNYQPGELSGFYGYDFKQYNATYPTAPAQASGNGMLFSYAPTLRIAGQVSGAVSKVYDGTTDSSATLAGTLSVTGLAPDDELATPLTANGMLRYASANVGQGIALTMPGLSSTPTIVDTLLWASEGPARPVYGYRYQSQLDLTGAITPRPLSLASALVNDKVYDGTRTATFNNAALVGLVPGETLSLSATDLLFDTQHVGNNKLVTGTLVLADGNALASNYDFTQTGAFRTTASITPRPVTVSGMSAADKVYDGTRTAVVSGGTIAGVVPGEDLRVAVTGAQFDTKDVGRDKPVIATLALADGSNARASNYTAATEASLTASITPKPLALENLRANNKMFDGTTAATVSATGLTGLVSGESLGYTLAGAFETPDVGANKPVPVHTTLADGANGRASNYSIAEAMAHAAIAPRPQSGRLYPDPDGLFPQPEGNGVRDAQDALPALRPADGGYSFRPLDIERLDASVLQRVLGAREALKRSVFSSAIRQLEQNPSAADAPPCQTAEQAAAGLCLVTEALKPALRQYLVEREATLAAVAPGAAAQALPATAPTAPTAPAVATPAPTVPLQSAPTPTPAQAPTQLAAARPAPAAALRPVRALQMPRPRAVQSAMLPQIQRKWALLIGTDRYDDQRIPQLENAVADADAMARVLDRRLGYQTVVLKDGSKAEILRAFNAIAALAEPTDSVVVYYAGHGELVDSIKQGFWQPSDADAARAETWLSNADINRLLGRMNAQQVALVSDSCFSGSLVADERIRGVSATADAAALLARRAAVVMSSGGNEPVADASQNGHSPFAASLLGSLDQLSRWKPGASVFEQVRFQVARKVPQRPQYGAAGSGRHESGADYLFEQRQLAEAAR